MTDKANLKLSLGAEAWLGVCRGSGVWAAKPLLLESLENNFMPCSRGADLSSLQHKHPCYFVPAPRNQLNV